ncbi:MAG: RluA family pseudouridine synthase [Coriobacteriia bacterium]
MGKQGEDAGVDLDYSVPGRFSGMRLDRLLVEADLVPSRATGQKLVEGGLVRVNGAMTSKNYRVSAGDLVHVYLPPEAPEELMAEDIPLDIRYEDEHLLVLSKQAGLVVHPTDQHPSGTLVNALLAHCETLGTLGGPERSGIVHRLDKDTSGLMLVAKDDETQRLLQEAIRIRSVDRRYLTLVHGHIAPDSGLIDAPVGRDPRTRMKMTVSFDDAAKQAVTNFVVLARYEAGRHDDGFTMLECKLHTGRTHQIRVHMAHINHHVVGDQTYGRRRSREELGLSRQFLHSYRLSLTHPVTGETLEFEDSLPDDLRAAIGRLSDRGFVLTEAGNSIGHILVGAAEADRPGPEP